MSKNKIFWKDVELKFHDYTGIKASADWDIYCQLMPTYDMREVEILGEQPFIPQLLAKELGYGSVTSPTSAIFCARRPTEQDEAIFGQLWLYKNITYRCMGSLLTNCDGRERTIYHWEVIGMPVDAGRTLVIFDEEARKENARILRIMSRVSENPHD
jgi:hypothetical protein